MRYTLAFLTHKGREEAAALTLRSFAEHVRPRPDQALLVYDGGTGLPLPPRVFPDIEWNALTTGEEPTGFCNATGALWKMARHTTSGWVFWLEDDFEFLRTVDLDDLAFVMQQEPSLAQMALMRGPHSYDEVQAGGYMQLTPDAYTQLGQASSRSWIRHRRHWTTNPSLIHKSVIDQVAWPQREPECEGKFREALMAAFPETTFGIWGVGDKWVEHFGVRTGHGY